MNLKLTICHTANRIGALLIFVFIIFNTLIITGCSGGNSGEKSRTVEINSIDKNNTLQFNIPEALTVVESSDENPVVKILSSGKLLCEMSLENIKYEENSLVKTAKKLIDEKHLKVKKITKTSSLATIYKDETKEKIIGLYAIAKLNSKTVLLLKYQDFEDKKALTSTVKSIKWLKAEDKSQANKTSEKSNVSSAAIDFTPDISFLDDPYWIYSEVTFEQAYSVFLINDSLVPIMDKLHAGSGFEDQFRGYSFSMEGTDGHVYTVKEDYVLNKFVFLKSDVTGEATLTSNRAIIIDEKPLGNDCNLVNTYHAYMKHSNSNGNEPTQLINLNTIDQILETGNVAPFLSGNLTPGSVEDQENGIIIFQFYAWECKSLCYIFEDYNSQTISCGLARVDKTDPPAEYWKYNTQKPLSSKANRQQYVKIGVLH